MHDLGAAFSTALGLVAAGDPALAAIVGPFPRVSVTAVAVAALVGLPPVVAGLLIYLLLSRSGPLGGLGLLFTPAAMVVAQAVLIAPILAALSRQALEGCVAKMAAGCEWPRQTKGHAAIWNSSATKAACARMSRRPASRTCPFLTIAIAS